MTALPFLHDSSPSFWQLIFMLDCSALCLTAYLSAWQLTCPPDSLPAWQLTCMPDKLPFCLTAYLNRGQIIFSAGNLRYLSARKALNFCVTVHLLSDSLFLCLTVQLFAWQLTCPPDNLSVLLTAYLSAGQPTCMPDNLAFCLPAYLNRDSSYTFQADNWCLNYGFMHFLKINFQTDMWVHRKKFVSFQLGTLTSMGVP